MSSLALEHPSNPVRAAAPRRERWFSAWQYLLLIVTYVVFDYCSYFLPSSLGMAVALLHTLAIVAAGVVNMRLGVTLMLVSVVFADDISRLDPYGNYSNLQNLMTVPVAGVAAGNLSAMLLIGMGFFFALLGWSRRPVPLRLRFPDYAVLLIIGLYTIASLHAFGTILGNFRGAVNDLNNPLLLAGFYFLVRFYFTTPRRLLRLWRWIVIAMAAKATVWAAWFALGVGWEFGSTVRVSFGSVRFLLVLVLAYGLVLQQHRLHLPLRERLLGLTIVFAAAFNLFINASRGAWLMAIFAFGVLFVLGDFREKFKWGIAGAVMVVGVVGTTVAVNPEAFRTLGHLASTLRFWEEGALESSTSTMIRVYELKNIHAQLGAEDNYIWGSGPASTFSDRFHPFPFPLKTGDYEVSEVLSRKFQNPHGIIGNLLLNTGYGGLTLYILAMGLLYLAALRVYLWGEDEALRAAALTLLAFLPVLVYGSWSPATRVILGALMGIIGVLYVRSLAPRKERLRAARAEAKTP
jgi:hypothetical protein